MKKQCLECNGTGTVDAPMSYRESAANPEEKPMSKPKRSWGWWLATAAIRTIPWAIIFSLVAFFSWLFCIEGPKTRERWRQESREAMTAHNQPIEKMGYVIAQYSSEETVSHCWIVKPQTTSYGDPYYEGWLKVVGPAFPHTNMTSINWVEVPDRTDVDGFARSLQITDPSKCIGYEGKK